VRSMTVAVVEVVNVTSVRYREVPATGGMGVRVVGMLRLADGHLGFSFI
jgi:hypothetical protein